MSRRGRVERAGAIAAPPPGDRRNGTAWLASRRRRNGFVAMAAALAGLATAAAPGRAAAQHDPFAGAIAEFEARLAADVAADGVGSIAAAVVVDDEVIWQNALGWADPDRRVAATPETIYRTGSISKSMTAVVLMRLVDRGVVGLDDPIEAYVPELDRLANRSPDYRPITFRDLATHTSGLAREPGLEHSARGGLGDWDKKLVASLSSTELLGPPGEVYRYSNVGYAILGLALQRAAGRPFQRLVGEHVFEPLGMTSSRFRILRWEADRLATGYVNLDDGTVDPRVPRAEHRGRGYKVPNGGVYSTVGDLGRFVMGLTGALGDTLLTPAARSAMLRDGSPATGRGGYGLGLQLVPVGGVNIAGHSGSVAGYTAYLAFEPETRIGVILMRNYNRGETNLGAVVTDLLLELVEVAQAGT